MGSIKNREVLERMEDNKESRLVGHTPRTHESLIKTVMEEMVEGVSYKGRPRLNRIKK